MRSILDGTPGRWAIPLVLLALLSEAVDDLELTKWNEMLASEPPALLSLTVAGILFLVAIVGVGLFYVYAWIVTLVGRYALEGAGSYREVLSALAWGLAPIIAALIYRFPVLFFSKPSSRAVSSAFGDTNVVWNPGLFGGESIVLAFLIGFLEVVFFFWFVLVSSITVGEAHRFSGWRGLACLLISWITPGIIALAIVLTIITSS